MKVLFSKHNSICEVGISRAFCNIGLEVISWDRKMTNLDCDESFQAELGDIIEREKPDFVFSINFIPIIAKTCMLYNKLKYLCWIVDSPVLPLYNESAINLECNYIFTFDSVQYAEFASRCVHSHIFHFPLGCDIEAYDEVQITDADHTLYDSDVSFVGSLYTEKSPYDGIEHRLPKYIQGYLRAVMEAQSRVCGFNFIKESINKDVLGQLEKNISLYNPDGYNISSASMICNFYLNPKCTEMERIRIINSIAECYNVDMYTASDVGPLKGVNCKGVVGTYGGMPRVFKCSKINLNITAKGIQSGGSLRVYDILGCHGFLITNYQVDLANQFVDGEELVFYYDDVDLIEKIGYYLGQPEERKRIADNGYKKVKQFYTYTVRIREMLKLSQL